MQYDLNDNSYSGFEAGVYEELKRQFTEVTLLQQRDFHRLFRAKRMGRWYFLKALRPELQDKAIYRQMLHKEMEILKQLQHPKIVACEGIENVEARPSDGGDPVGECIIMEYIDGLTLKEWLEETISRKKSRRREAQNIINGILDAMSYMHASGITHRDLKPSNVMLTRNGHSVKIIDFSLSDADNYAILKQPSGTQQYMSPEQASIPIPDVRNDIYSLGVIMQQMPLGGIWKTVSKRCLLPIEQRYANIDELRSDIQHRTKRATLWRWSLMGLIALLCLLSVAFLWYLASVPYLPSDSKLVECRRRVFQVFGIGNIDFADEKVKAICIQNWDTDGDGEFNKYEAAQVMDLGEVFRDQSEIKSFDELQYFTGLNSIGNDAFNGCSNLSSLTLPFTLAQIGEKAFFNCSSLVSLDFPQRLTTIENEAFNGCSALTSVHIPSGLTHIWEYIFNDCSSLTSISVDPANPVYTDGDGSNCIIEKARHILKYGCQNTVIPSDVTVIGMFSFYGRSGLTSIAIPEGVTSLDYFCFGNCSGLSSVSLPSNLKSIGDDVFSGCSALTSIAIPKNVTKLKYNVLSDCSSLTSISVDSANPVFNDGEGRNCIIETATHTLKYGCQNTVIPPDVTAIDDFAFGGCSHLKSFIVPPQVTRIGKRAFYGCSRLTSFAISARITHVGDGVLGFCSGLKSITVDPSNPVYNDDGGKDCIVETASNKLIAACQSTVIPSCITSIGEVAFAGNQNVTSIILPSSVTSIGHWAFYGSSLASITIPRQVTDIGSEAFYNCADLISVTAINPHPILVTPETFVILLILVVVRPII